MTLRASIVLATLAAALAVSPRAGAGEPGVRLRRFALLIGVNDGGPERVRLRYATSDARAMARVLESLGGVAPGDLVFVADGNRRALEDGFAAVGRLMREGRTPGVRRELLVYYSGHSDEEGLLLGRDRVRYDELRALIRDTQADLRVAILDSCASGAFTRHKGGTRRPPFLLDASIDMRGHAFLTSSAANEVAQESDRIAASFFTYYLVSGLRGAADANQDRRVTLQEAFQFASEETLARTERTQGGPQHAAYEFDLSGTGDMVVTDVRSTQAGLVLTPELSGRISVREAGGALVAELRKPPGNTVELGLDAGTYVVAMESGAATFEAQLTLTAGEHAPLARAAFHVGAPLEVAVARGDAPAATAQTVAPPPSASPGPPAHETTSFKADILPRSTDATTDVDGFAFGFIAVRAAALHGFQLTLGYAQVDTVMRGAQLSIGANVVGERLSGAQITVGANVVRGPAQGAQLAVGANVTNGDLRGLQMVSGVNVVTGTMTGMQATAGFNIAREAKGLQLAAGVNFAQEAQGAQMGVVNVAGEADGLRLGVVNVARKTRGFGLGVVNVSAHEDGESFALVNIVGNGIHDIAVYGTDALLANVALKLGSRHLFTSFSFSYQPGDTVAGGPVQIEVGSRRIGFGGGVGWRQPLDAGRLAFLEIEAVTTNLHPDATLRGNELMLDTLRATLGVRLAAGISLLAGAGANVLVATDGTDFNGLLAGAGQTYHDGRTTVRLYPGFLLGLQI